MSALQAYATHIASAMDILAEAHGMSERALIDLGLPDVEAHDLRALAAVYFGPTHFSRKQRHATTAARHHDLVTLKLIEKYVSRVRTNAMPGTFALSCAVCEAPPLKSLAAPNSASATSARAARHPARACNSFAGRTARGPCE